MSVQILRGLSRYGQFCTRLPIISPNYTRMKSSFTFKSIETFGKIRICDDTPTSVRYDITLVDPQKYPDQNVAFINSDLKEGISCERTKNEISVTCLSRLNSEDGIQCTAQVPIKFDVDCTLSGASDVHVSGLENDSTSVTVDHGSCRLTGVQTGNFRLTTESGHVVSEKLLQGNGKITTNSGDIRIHKIQSVDLSVESVSGDVWIRNLYSTRTIIKSDTGHVNITNSHWDTDILTGSGNITVGSVDGRLCVLTNAGDIHVTLSQHTDVHLTSLSGNVTVLVPTSVTSQIELQGAELELHPELQLKDASGERHNMVSKKLLLGLTKHDGDVAAIFVANAPAGKVTVAPVVTSWISMIQQNMKK